MSVCLSVSFMGKHDFFELRYLWILSSLFIFISSLNIYSSHMNIHYFFFFPFFSFLIIYKQRRYSMTVNILVCQYFLAGCNDYGYNYHEILLNVNKYLMCYYKIYNLQIIIIIMDYFVCKHLLQFNSRMISFIANISETHIPICLGKPSQCNTHTF